MSDQAVPEGCRLRKGQVYTWQEVMDWADEHARIGWGSPQGEPLRYGGDAGRSMHVLPGEHDDIACFMCVGTDGAETIWTCTYVAPEYALPPLHYYGILLWNGDEGLGEMFLTRATGHIEATDKANEEVLKWPGYMVWDVKHIDPRPVEAGMVVHLGGG